VNSLPPFHYRSKKCAQVEIEQFFRGGWIGVGRADIVKDHGNFISLDIAGQNIILLRDEFGELRAYANTCRHRATRLVDGSGNCKGLRCPFHSWFYGLDGKLKSAPQMDTVSGFDKSDYNLVSYRAEERLGFVFVSLSQNVCELDEHLGDLSDLHIDWPLETLVSVRRQELEVDCNWKAFLEVFNEYYHLPFVHANSIDRVYAHPDAADRVSGAYATQFGATDGTGGLLEKDQSACLPTIPGLSKKAKQGVRYTWIFPNMTFAANGDALWCYEAYPLGASRCKVVQTCCFPAESIALAEFDEKSQAYFKRMDAALDEDIRALENQHRGFLCQDALSGPFQPDLEPNIAAFATWYNSVWTST